MTDDLPSGDTVIGEWRILVVAAVGAIGVVLAGARPTGRAGTDIVLVGLAGAAVIWSAATAPWWAPAAAVGVGAASSLDPTIAAVGMVGLVVGLLDGATRREVPELRAVVAAVAVNVLARSALGGFLGLSAIVAIAAGGLVVVVGLLRRPSANRRWTRWALAGVAGVALVCSASAALTLAGIRSDLTTANRQARQAIDALNAGEFERASALFAQASRRFTEVDGRLRGPVAAPAWLVPAVAQNLDAGQDLASAAADATAVASSALDRIDPSSLRVRNGTIDLAAISAVEAPLLDVQQALFDLKAATEGISSPWLLARVQQELDELPAEFAENETRLANAIEAVRLAPDMLGASGVRRYLVLFTTPSEARGLGGFVGNYAEVTVDAGAIDVSEFGRRSDLEASATARRARCDGCQADLLRWYGLFGFASGPAGSVGPGVWANLTMPAHFPLVADAARVLYPQSGGRPVDGVIVMDPYVVATLMTYTGAVEIPELGVVVEPDDAAEFLLRDQYLLAAEDGEVNNAERIDALETLGRSVIERLLSSTLPDPASLSRDLSPLVAERRLLFWSSVEREAALLERTGLLGSMPDLGPDGGFSVAVSNASGSKIEIFLEREVDVRLEGEGADRRLAATVRLTNHAPTAGWPSYVIGNLVGLPSGWSRLIVTCYGPEGLLSTTLDGEPVSWEPIEEGGWHGVRGAIDLAPGGTVELRLEYAVPATDAARKTPARGAVVWAQPGVER